MIDSNVSFKISPFAVPNSVVEYNNQGAYAAAASPQVAPSFQAAPQPVTEEYMRPYIAPRQFQLSEIPASDLLLMCEEFKREVFDRAGKSEYLLTSVAGAGGHGGVGEVK